MRLLSLGVALLIGLTSVRADDFFNGKDLTGWKGLAQHWSVENVDVLGKNDVQGLVTGVTSENSLISLNRGSNHGLAKGQNLEVYRLHPKAEWLGRIKIIQVTDHEAVGTIILPQNRKVTVLKGDLVGNSILPAGKGAMAIHGTTQPKGINFNTFLCSEKEYSDFELKLQVKLTAGGNSGVQIRSKIDDPPKFVVGGPQCDMGQQYWGSLYGERFGGMMKASDAELVKKVVKVGEFNDYHIVCQGKHVTIKINGTTMLDGDFPKMPEKGIIAFQIHGGGPMDVYFKNIEFKDLTPGAAPAEVIYEPTGRSGGLLRRLLSRFRR